jgi:hypothetical protein
MPREGAYQTDLIKRIESMFPGCFILKNDPSYVQGVPDIIILYGPFWAMLEVKKKNSSAVVQANQEYWVGRLNEMSFAAFISPEIEEDVLYDLQRAFGVIG